MQPRRPVYGLDIETDTSVNGLDPAVGGIVTVALSGPDGDEVFDGLEIEMLAAVDARLAGLTPGVLATWNGAFLDLPFLADRAAHHGVALGLRLTLDPRIPSQAHQPGRGPEWGAGRDGRRAGSRMVPNHAADQAGSSGACRRVSRRSQPIMR
jgi:hypothetical protein